MKTKLLIGLLLSLTLVGYSQPSKKLATENKELKAKILLYEMLITEQDKAIKQLESIVALTERQIPYLNPRPTIRPIKEGDVLFINYFKRNVLLDRDIYIKGNIWLIRGCDTILVKPK